MGRKNKKKIIEKSKKFGRFALPEEIKKKIGGVVTFLLAIIVTLSFIEQAGWVGGKIFAGLNFLVGRAVFLLPLVLVLAGLTFFLARYKKFLFALILAVLLFILGTSGIFGILNLEFKDGGWLGYLTAQFLFRFFGFWVSLIVFAGVILISGLIFWHLLKRPASFSAEDQKAKTEASAKPSLIKRFFTPSFKIKEVEPPTTFEVRRETESVKEPSLELKTQLISSLTKGVGGEYQRPPLELLDSEKEKPTAGDIRVNSAIIKKTLENFEIPVEMSGINVGPTVTQYTLKPADGIKLSKITTLSNDLSLALASHPIRIEAPIPGKPLVGIEIPNRVRAQVRLRELIAASQFQNSLSDLALVLGRDVSGNPVYADLGRMPHLLVAGSTGTGKTIFLNSLILSLLYRNSPETLRFILIDPKRVEFSIYKELPHLLSPVIFDAQKTVNALKWLISEMERRFDVLSGNGSRDITSYNEKVSKEGEPSVPFIVLIIDELADLMAARGREVEAGIVRLAQMSRAVGIHLVVATQRPSVEVITGLIKANITSRITFQVASQIDSRTVLDMAGAEKLLGAGDLLFISAEIAKPKRIQGAYVSEREVKKVVNWLETKIVTSLDSSCPSLTEEILEEGIASSFFQGKEGAEFETGEDLLYEEAKRVVSEAKKASASLLQRRLRIGYARAARLIDILEERGVVGPGEGAKPREVYIKTDEEDKEWEKV
ncbi:MAG TPA: DNA translocase FtsK [Candidatus Humimicrobiaceae bacterium]|nr:DNA translocase FtsK [Candidatus Humimicrobiaceae bacterium]